MVDGHTARSHPLLMTSAKHFVMSRSEEIPGLEGAKSVHAFLTSKTRATSLTFAQSRSKHPGVLTACDS